MKLPGRIRIAVWVLLGILTAAGLGGLSVLEIRQDIDLAAADSSATPPRSGLSKAMGIFDGTPTFRTFLHMLFSPSPPETVTRTPAAEETTKSREERSTPAIDPPQPPAKVVPIESLKLSPHVLKVLREEREGVPSRSGGLAGTASPSSPKLSDLSAPKKNAEDLPRPWDYRPNLFIPGLMANGKPIWPSPVDLSALVPVVTGPPDYSLETSAAAKGRLLSLGNGGVIVLEVIGGYVVDGDGPDLVIFENPFVYNGPNGTQVYVETARVSVAEFDDPSMYRSFPCDPSKPPYSGCAGVGPVRYAPQIPLTEDGGDLFDLATIGLQRIRYIRIEDTGDNPSFSLGTEGFDLDAIGLIHTSR